MTTIFVLAVCVFLATYLLGWWEARVDPFGGDDGR